MTTLSTNENSQNLPAPININGDSSNIFTALKGAGINPMDMVEKMGELKILVEKIKGFLPMAEQFKTTLEVPKDAELMYCLIPVNGELMVVGYGIKQDNEGRSKLVFKSDEQEYFFFYKGVEELEKFVNLFPV